MKKKDTRKFTGRTFSAAALAEWHQAIARMYDGMKKRSEKGAYKIECGGLTFTVMPNVYAPAGFFTDTFWLPNG